MADYPAPEWKPVEPFPFALARKSFRGPTSDDQLVELRYFQRPDGVLVATAAFGAMSEGAPGQVHGGMVLTVLDEALGAAVWITGRPVLTVKLDTEFRRSVPMRVRLLVETRVISARHRLTIVSGELRGEGAVYARATGRFMELNEEAQRRIFKTP